MTMTDPVADLLNRIRNAISAKHASLNVPASKVKLEIVRILKEEGYIENYVFSSEEHQGLIRIYPRYVSGKKPAISTLERISRPGCRVYARKSEIPKVMGGLGVAILSTSQGILTGKQAAEKGLGGEVLCSVS
jgi:small subunit ribosomal protein S8